MKFYLNSHSKKINYKLRNFLLKKIFFNTILNYNYIFSERISITYIKIAKKTGIFSNFAVILQFKQ